MIAIAALPFVITNRALAAPAILKSALNQHGIDSTALDLNNEVVVRVDASVNKELLYRALLDNFVSDEVIAEYSYLVKFCAKKILDLNPSLIGLSLFCLSCRPFCHWLCAELRQHTDVPIVLGGPGIVGSLLWLDELRSNNLITDYILGDGEVSFVQYVLGNKTNTSSNVKNWEMLSSLTESVIPDYSDYNFYAYSEPSIPIVDSRGCVQSCEFCNVIEIWKKFQYKSAEDIFNEMLYQIDLYNIYHFDFRSSISNGNLKEFTKLMALIADYNQDRFRSEQISWEGSFIVRSNRNEKIWDLMSNTNGALFLGVESLVEDVRKDMGKNFTNEDLTWTLDQIKKYKINAKILLISGYPTETLQDWNDTKQWFTDNKHYATMIREVQITKASIIPGTELYRKKTVYGIEQKPNTQLWVNHKTNISIEQRDAYHHELVKLAKSLGFNVSG